MNQINPEIIKEEDKAFYETFIRDYYEKRMIEDGFCGGNGYVFNAIKDFYKKYNHEFFN